MTELEMFKGLVRVGQAEHKLALMLKDVETLTALLQQLREQMDAGIAKAFGVARQDGESTYDALGRRYGLRSDQMQLYAEARAAGSRHEEAERAALAQRIQ